MLRVSYLETPFSLPNIVSFVLRAGVLVDTTFVHPIWPGLVRGAKDVLEFVPCGDERIAARLLQGAFEFVCYSSWYKWYFGVGAKLNAVVAVVDVIDAVGDLLGLFSHVSM